jgi:F-type H+-transporting ATPase subunit gamma
MASAKEIRTKIASIEKTQKITRAMEMVAASKMRKTQDRMAAGRPYAEKIRQVVGHLAWGHSEYHHTFLQEREVKRLGLIVVSTDRGLCGGLNINLFKKALQFLKEEEAKDIKIDLSVIGRKGQAFFSHTGGNITAYLDNLGDSPKLTDVVGVVKVMIEAFEKGEIDALYVASNKFVNTMTQKPEVEKLLPLPKIEEEQDDLSHYWDYIYEPDARSLIDLLLKRFIELQVYQAVLENVACEQAAKMIAMKSASDNAGELIKEFRLAYNKARQAAITQELAEIVSGADAL